MATSTTKAPGGRARPLPPDERRAAIIAAVIPLLIQQGPTVTTREMAAAAGVSEGTIFKVFADKDEVVAAAVDHALDPSSAEEAFGDIDRSAPLEAQVRQATELVQQRIVDIWRLISQLSPDHRHEARRPLPDSAALTAIFQAHAERIRIEPAEAARFLRAITLSLSHPLLVDRPRPAAEIVDVFLHGVTLHGVTQDGVTQDGVTQDGVALPGVGATR